MRKSMIIVIAIAAMAAGDARAETKKPKVSHQDIHFTKKLDKASPILMKSSKGTAGTSSTTKLGDIKGESTDDKHKDWISSRASPGNKGLTRPSAAALAGDQGGMAKKTAKTGRKAGGKPLEYMTIKMPEATISSVRSQQTLKGNRDISVTKTPGNASRRIDPYKNFKFR